MQASRPARDTGMNVSMGTRARVDVQLQYADYSL